MYLEVVRDNITNIGDYVNPFAITNEEYFEKEELMQMLHHSSGDLEFKNTLKNLHKIALNESDKIGHELPPSCCTGSVHCTTKTVKVNRHKQVQSCKNTN